MHFGIVTAVAVHPFHIHAVALLNQPRTSHAVGNHHRTVVNDMTFCAQYAERKRVVSKNIDRAVVLNYRIGGGIGIQLHTSQSGIGGAFGTEIDNTVVNQLCVFIAFHRHGVVAADVHYTIVESNIVVVGEFNRAGVVFIEVNYPAILVPQEGIAFCRTGSTYRHGDFRIHHALVNKLAGAIVVVNSART